VIVPAAAVALVSCNIGMPTCKPAASNWAFTLTHPTILLHMIVATRILVMAVIALINPARSRDLSLFDPLAPGTLSVRDHWVFVPFAPRDTTVTPRSASVAAISSAT